MGMAFDRNTWNRIKACTMVNVVASISMYFKLYSANRNRIMKYPHVGPPIPTMFGNTGISVLKELNTGIPVLIPVLG